MDVLDGFLDSHYSFTANQQNYAPIPDSFYMKQLSATERELKLNHLNVIYFTTKISHRNILSFGLSKLKENTDHLEEKYILIS